MLTCAFHGRLTPTRGRRACRAADTVADTVPYSLLSTPVYALSTRCKDGRSNMHLVTYASPIALQPRKYAIGLFKQALSYQNFRETQQGVLQILCTQHAALFTTLGKTSGRNADKLQLIRGAGFALTDKFGLPVLSDALGVMELQLASDFIAAGDHDVVICNVTNYETMHSTSQPLYTQDLRAAGLLS